jgi:enterochelin esterase family protein
MSCHVTIKNSGPRPEEGVGIFAQPEPYDTPPEALGPLGGAPAGHLSDSRFFVSSIYPGLRFEYRIYVPAQYDSAHAAALMVFQDGRTFINVLRTPQVLDNLIHAGAMPATIAVFVMPGNPDGVYRSPDHVAFRSEQYDELSDRYVQFLAMEFLPDVVGRYNISRDPGWRGIGGQSSGGIAAFTAAWQRPDQFRRVLTMNGSFTDIRGGNRYPDMILHTSRKPLRVYLLSGTNDLNNQFGGWFDANTLMAAALGEKGYPYRFRAGSGGHFPPLQGLADYPDALRWLWRGVPGYQAPPPPTPPKEPESGRRRSS